MFRPHLLAALLLALSLDGQDPPVISESIEVRITNVEVIVTNGEGKRAEGLKVADFEVYEDGVLQPITNFSEYGPEPVRADPGPATELAVADLTAPPVPRRVVLFLDRVVLSDRQRIAVFDAYADLMRRVLGPGDEAMVVIYDTGMKVAVDFTADLQKIDAALRKIGKGARTNWERDELKELENLRRLMESSPEFDVEGHMATSTRQVAMQKMTQLKNRVQSLNALLTSLSGLEGRKILILSSDRFTQYAGLDVFMPRDFSGPPPADSHEFNTGRLIRSLAATSNASGFTIYAFHPRGVRDGQSSAEFQQAVSGAREYQLLQNEAAGLDELARETGGLLALGPADVQQSVAKIAEDLSSYYSIGFRTRGEPGRQRELTVKVKKEGLRVRNRKGLLVRTPEAEIGDRVVANLFRKSDSGDAIRIRLTKGDVRRKGSNNIVPVKIQIPIAQLTALPTDAGFGGSISLYVASADPRGGYSNVIRQTKPFTIAAGDMARAKKSYFTYEIEIATNGAKVSVAVVDEISKAAGFEVIEMPMLAENRAGPKGIKPSEKTPAEKRGEGW